MPRAVSELFAPLDKHPEPVSLEQLTAFLADLEIGIEDVRPYLHFDNSRYQRNLMRSGPAYHALLLCWRNGQRSVIHDHRDSCCAVRIIQGVATETLFERSANGLMFATSSRELAPGSVCGGQDMDTHQISNLQGGGEDLVTLHVYSPPLLVMGSYSLTEPAATDFVDPIFEFTDAAGI